MKCSEILVMKYRTLDTCSIFFMLSEENYYLCVFSSCINCGSVFVKKRINMLSCSVEHIT